MYPPISGSPGSVGSDEDLPPASPSSAKPPEDTPLTQLFNNKIAYLKEEKRLTLEFTPEEKMWMITKMKEGCSPFEDGRLGCDNNPIMTCLRAGREDLVKFLVENTRRHSGKLRMKALKRCLAIAAQYGQATAFAALLESCDGKKLRHLLISFGARLLCTACTEGLEPELKVVFPWEGEYQIPNPDYHRIVHYLYQCGLNLNFPLLNQAPFVWAARRNTGDILRLFRDCGADIRPILHTAMATAFYYENIAGFTVLLDLALDIDPRHFRQLLSHCVWPHTLLGYMICYMHYCHIHNHYAFVKAIVNHRVFSPHTSDFYLVNQVTEDLHLFVELINSGHFSPVSGVTKMYLPIQRYRGSPLCNALLSGKPYMAQICLGKNFLVMTDVTHLAWDPFVRESIQNNEKMHLLHKERCLSILSRMECSIPSLYRLTLISFTEKIGVRNDRKEVIESFGLPANVKNALLFKDSSISCFKFLYDKNAWIMLNKQFERTMGQECCPQEAFRP